MEPLRKLAAIILLGACAILAFQQGEIPPTDDPSHPNQPAFCINFATKEFRANCDCKPKAGSEACKERDAAAENAKCSVYCRREACRCSELCTTRMNPRPKGHVAVAE